MKIPRNAFAHVIEALLTTTDARSAVRFVTEDLVVKASRRHYRANGNAPYKNQRSESIVVTFGKPNYRERLYVRRCRKAGQPVPTRGVWCLQRKRGSK